MHERKKTHCAVSPIRASLIALSLLIAFVVVAHPAGAVPAISPSSLREQPSANTLRIAKKKRIVTVTKGAKVNGCSVREVVEHGKKTFIFTAENVIDPLTGKRLEGKHKGEFRCKLGSLPIIESLFFRNGRSEPTEIKCFLTARIIIEDEEG